MDEGGTTGLPPDGPGDPWRVLRRQQDRRRYLGLLSAGTPDSQPRGPAAAAWPRAGHHLLGPPASVARSGTYFPDPDDVRDYLDHSCDITMTGGTRAAAVHPLAACALAEHYVFRRIAGASAGAVAAAGAAAAELGRTAPDPVPAPAGLSVVPGFAGLAEIVGWLTGQDAAGQDAAGVARAQQSPEQPSRGPARLLRRGAPGREWPEQHRLARLFQPAPGARGLFRLAVAALQERRPGSGRSRAALATALLAAPGAGAAAVAVLLWTGALAGWAGLLTALARTGGLPGWVVASLAVPLAVTFALAAGAGSALAAGLVLRHRIPARAREQNFGLVPGVAAPGSPPRRRAARIADRLAGVRAPDGVPPLAEWVADRLDDLAGVPRPDGQAGQARYALTFGELWLGRLGTRSAEDLELLRRAARDPQERVVDLVLAAADVSQGRPHRLPFPAPGRRGAGTSTGTGTGSAWLFCHDCLAGVLPARVVEQMVLTSPAQVPEATCPRHPEQTLQQVPDPWDFPVVAAVRMAVSTPGLLSAVPLHALEPDGPPGGTRAGDPAAGRGARIHWFCDGGLTGTLGVDAFDALLPRWPTFAVTLDSAPGPALSLPEQDSGPQRRPWRAVDTAGSFVLALLGTAAGWRDRVQAELPGLRGRVAQVQAGPRAGSLFPDQATILDLAVRGHQAGTALRERFTGPDGELSRQTQTDRYRWIRLRAALRELRGLSVDLGARLPLYSDLATGYRVPAALHAWFDPPLAPGAVDRSWPDAAAAVTHVRALSAGGVLDWDTDDGAPPAERDLTPGPPP